MTETLHAKELAFVSRIISGATHEFKNHLAIINESAGLMKDLLAMAGAAEMANRERFEKIITTIEEKVALAADLTLSLNRFGHRLDLPRSRFSVDALLQEAVALLRRQARQQQMELALLPSAAELTVYNSPALCHYLVAAIIDYLSQALAPQSTIQITAAAAGEAVAVTFSGPGPLREAAGDLTQAMAQWQPAVEQLAASLASETAGGTEKIILRIPEV